MCDARAASSAKSISRISTSVTLVLAGRRAMLKSLPSALVWMYSPSLQSLKAYWRSMEKNMQKSVGARTEPCFTPLLTGKASEVAPLNHTVLCMLSWNDVTTANRCEGQPIFWRSLKSPLLLTKSKAFVKSMKARYRGICCSWHFS